MQNPPTSTHELTPAAATPRRRPILPELAKFQRALALRRRRRRRRRENNCEKQFTVAAAAKQIPFYTMLQDGYFSSLMGWQVA